MSGTAENKLDIEEAKKLVDEEKKKRQDECAKEISEVLRKHNCTIKLDPIVTVVSKD